MSRPPQRRLKPVLLVAPRERRGERVRRLVAERPRHVVLAALVAGLALGPHVPALVPVLAFAAAGALRARRWATTPLVAALTAAACCAGGAWAAHRVAALERTDLPIGREGAFRVTLTAAAREDRSGGLRAQARLDGEPVVLRLPRWAASAAAGGSPDGASSAPGGSSSATSSAAGGSSSAAGGSSGAASSAAGGSADAAFAPSLRTARIGEVLDVDGVLLPPDRGALAVRAHGTLRATAVRSTGLRRGGLLGAVDRVRDRSQDVLRRGPPQAADAALLEGMVLGQDAALPAAVRDDLRASGLAHLVAASGANVLLLVGLVLAAGAVGGVPIRPRRVIAVPVVATYVLLAGAGPSILRAGVMGGAAVLALAAGRTPARWYVLLLAAAVTLALDPRALFDAGWQMSFAAVLAIALVAPPLREAATGRGLPPWAADAVAVTVCATLATAPVAAAHFGTTSLVAVPANVAAAPAVAPATWLGMLAAATGQVAPPLGGALAGLAAPAVAFIRLVGTTAAGLPAAQVEVPPALVAAVGALLLAALALAPRAARSRRARVLAVLAAVGAAALVLQRAAPSPVLGPPAPGVLRVTGVDVGQGDATLVQAGEHAVLVDTGPPGTGLVPRLRRLGVDRLDVLVLTHDQADHVGATAEVLGALPVDLVLDGRRTEVGDVPPSGGRTLGGGGTDVRPRGGRVVAARAGRRLRLGPLTLRVLWPPPPDRAPPADDPNDLAVVLHAEAGGTTALLPADAESPVLAPLDLGPVDVLKVSHHGSDDPGLPALLDRLDPDVALVEVGAENTYGHPTPATIAALAAAVPCTARTDAEGTVVTEGRAGRVVVRALGR